MSPDHKPPITYDCTIYGYRRRHAIRRINRALRVLAAHGDTALDTEFIESTADSLEHRIDWVQERDGFVPRPLRAATPDNHDAN